MFGPVVAAAVCLPARGYPEGLADSKMLDAGTRYRLADEIRAVALAWGVGEADVTEIARLNILQATFLAMTRAVEAAVEAGVRPGLVLVDGPHAIPNFTHAQKALVKGDQRSLNIAAASILAKTHRDRLIEKTALEFPGYGLERHKGYATAQHRQALSELGLSPLHRASFCRNFLKKK